MFGAIFSFELKQSLKRPSTYIFFGLYFLFSMLIGLVSSGFLNTTQADTNTVLNSAYAIANLLVGLNGNILGMLNSVVLVSLMASAIQKDYEHNMHPFFFTKPIAKASYFFGRFAAAFLLGVMVMSGMLLGYALGLLPGIGTSLLGPWRWSSFLQPFFIFLLPNVFILGILFFSLTTFTRSTLAAYMTCIIMLIGRFVAEQLGQNMDYAYIAALLEPFGSNAYMHVTRYWTAAEQNSLPLPLDGVLLYNRLLWIGIALLVMLLSYNRFSFAQFARPFRLFKREPSASAAAEDVHVPISTVLSGRQLYGRGFAWRQLRYLAAFEFKRIVQSTFYIICCALAVVMIGVVYYYRGQIYDTQMQPLTQTVVSMVQVYSVLASIFVIFYAGTLVFRERDYKVDELIHATPVSNWVLYCSKYLGLLGAIGLMQLIAILVGVTIQFSESYFAIDWMQYLVRVLLLGMLSYAITIGICMALQVFASNKYIGFFLSLIPLMIWGIVVSLLEWDNKLYIFDSDGPKLPYSSLNGLGPMGPYLLYRIYWLSFVLFLGMLSLFFFARGKERHLLSRFRFSRKEVNGKMKVATVALLAVFLLSGGYIYYNTHVLNEYRSSKQMVQLAVDYEKQYKQYAALPMPRIVESNLHVDIYPERGALAVRGFYWLKNKHQRSIDTVYLNLFDEKSHFYYDELRFAQPAQLLVDDKVMGIAIYRLEQPLAPGDSIQMHFSFRYEPKGFDNSGSLPSMVVANGSFFSNAIMPGLGYAEAAELSSNMERKKHGLPEKQRMRAIDDSAAYSNTYIARDADWIRFEAVVSTSADQIAIAPGYLEREWTESGRRYFHYKMDNPILNFYAFQSARYAVRRDKWKDVNLEIYYHSAHDWNIDNMMQAMKQSLAYCSEHFSPYQFRQLRIVEFPAFASYAQSFANTIPFSEDIGFTYKVDTANHAQIDMPFYVTAHEVAHQWWAHQVIGADVQGATVMSETMAQYAALMVMERRYGKDNMKKFLKHEMDNYLRSRTFEGRAERPLMLVEQQSYIYYQKGSVIMYALKDYLGEDTLNAALQRYIQQVAFQEPPYTTAREFVAFIREATPDSLKYIISDFFEHITIYENYVKRLNYSKMDDGRYKVSLTVGSVKFRVDSAGNNQKVPVNDYIDIAVFGKKKAGDDAYNPLVFQRVKMDAPEKSFEFIVSELPESAGIDPYNKLIDRTPDNNLCKFGVVPRIPSLSTEDQKIYSIKVEAD
ncbi:MAG TPA: M1 family aminopeptidase [Edaphocola sp.]|nr:M1 family aminopeptidase [Edaphocola sp.]